MNYLQKILLFELFDFSRKSVKHLVCELYLFRLSTDKSKFNYYTQKCYVSNSCTIEIELK